MTTPRAREHDSHDTFLIASLATREPEAADDTLADARAMVETCPGCAALYADLLAISAAVPTAAMPPRPRDFRLTDADVARLQPRGWRRFMRTIGSPRDSITRPLALGFTTLGIAGLLFATLPSAFMGAGAATGGAVPSTVGAEQAPGDGAAASGAPASLPAAPAAAPSAEASTQDLTQTDGPDASDGDTSNVFEGSGEGDQGDNGRTTEASEDLAIRDDASGLSAIAIIAGSLLIVGLGIFLLRWSARRFGD